MVDHRTRVLPLAVAIAAACAGAPPAREHPSGAAAPSLAGEDWTDLALQVSGYDDAAERKEARFRLEALLRPILAHARAIPDSEPRAKALLADLHGQGGPLREYDARSTTLREILDQGRFNCLSASILYNLALDRVGLRGGAELLPTHARSLAFLPRGEQEAAVVVETTSPVGFDPDAETSARILAQVSAPVGPGQRALVGKGGVRVETPVLIGAMYVNRGSIAQERGDLPGAADLFARAEAAATNDAMRTLLRDQRAALLSQLAADDVMSKDPERVARAHASLLAAVKLTVSDPEIRRAVEANLRAAAERLVAAAIDLADEARARAVLRISGESLSGAAERAGLLAFGSSELARAAVKRSDFEAALRELEAATAQPVSPSEQGLLGAIAQNRCAVGRRVAQDRADRGDLDGALAVLERLRDASPAGATESCVTREDRRRALLLAAQQHFQGGKLDEALAIYRRGLKELPQDEMIRNNLLAVLERMATPKINAGRCDEAAPLIDEVAAIEPNNAYVRDARRACEARRRAK